MPAYTKLHSNLLHDLAVTTAKLAADAVTGAKIADDAIDSEHITDGSIDTAHIADDQITNALMADDAIDSAQIASGAIDAAHMAANSIDSASYVDASIDLAHMSANSVDSNQYVDGSIDPVHLADDAVTAAKLASDSVVSASIVDGSIVNADINASAAIADSKLATISTANKVSLAALDLDGGTDINAALVSADLIIVDDGAGGTNRTSPMSRVATYVSANLGAVAATTGTFSGNVTLGDADADTVTVKGVPSIVGVSDTAAATLYFKADESGADAGDEWKINVADGGVMTFGNDIASAGTHVAFLTITPSTNAASSTTAFATSVTIAGDLTVTGDDLTMGTNSVGAALIGDGTNYNPVVISGDATINAAGALTIAANAIQTGMVHDDVATELAGAGTTASSGVLNVIGGDGITANANDVAITAAQTTITSVLNAALAIGRDSQNDIDFGTDNTILFRANNIDQVKLIDNVLSPVADSDVDLGTSSLYWKDAYIDSITTSGNIAVGGNLTVAGTTTTENTTIIESTVTVLQFEGATDNSHETTFKVVEPTADTSFSLPALSAGNFFLPAMADTATDASAAVLAAEFALLDGATTPGTTAVAGGHGIHMNHAGTMGQTTVDTLDTYLAATSKALTNKTLTTPIIAEIDSGSSITLDATTSIVLDSDAGYWFFKDAGTTIGGLTNASSDFVLSSGVQDKDLIFKGNDGGSTITALTLDMSDAGAAAFNDKVTVGAGKLVYAGTAVGATGAELNLLDGSAKSTSSITLADADALVVIDGTSTVQIPVTDLDKRERSVRGKYVVEVDTSASAHAAGSIDVSGSTCYLSIYQSDSTLASDYYKFYGFTADDTASGVIGDSSAQMLDVYVDGVYQAIGTGKDVKKVYRHNYAGTKHKIVVEFYEDLLDETIVQLVGKRMAMTA